MRRWSSFCRFLNIQSFQDVLKSFPSNEKLPNLSTTVHWNSFRVDILFLILFSSFPFCLTSFYHPCTVGQVIKPENDIKLHSSLLTQLPRPTHLCLSLSFFLCLSARLLAAFSVCRAAFLSISSVSWLNCRRPLRRSRFLSRCHLSINENW